MLSGEFLVSRHAAFYHYPWRWQPLRDLCFPLASAFTQPKSIKIIDFQPLSYTSSSFKRENIFSKYLFFQFFTKSISKGFKKQFSFQVKAEAFLRENFAEIPWDTVRERVWVNTGLSILTQCLVPTSGSEELLLGQQRECLPALVQRRRRRESACRLLFPLLLPSYVL